MIKFHPDNHIYRSIDPLDDTQWRSASKLAGAFKEIFDGPAVAASSSLKKSSKWFGVPPEEILQIWQNENVRSTTLGTWYHEKQEQQLLGAATAVRYGHELPIFRPVWVDGWKVAGDQKLVDGIYPEHLAFVKSAGACGQFDEIIVADGFVNVDDHKSGKDIKKPAFKSWNGAVKKMLPPLAHLDDCKLVEHSLQLSIGMYMVLRHNPQLKPGTMTLNHITFELEGEDKYGYPIMRLDSNEEPIVKDVEKIQVPYMKREVELIFDRIKQKQVHV
jgi:hypothetical protein